MATDAKWARGKSAIPVTAATPISPKWSEGQSGSIPIVVAAGTVYQQSLNSSWAQVAASIPKQTNKVFSAT